MSGYKSEAFYIKLDKEIQKELCQKAISKAGSEKKLSFEVNIPQSTMYFYKNAFFSFPYYRFKRILKYLGLTESKVKFELVDGNDSRRVGGKKVYEKYVSQGRFAEIHSKLRVASSKYMIKWHKEAKFRNKESYYELQYSRFKKIAGYSIKTKKGDMIRNWLEKEVADFLNEIGVDYAYEKYLLANNKVYFPDFVCENTIIECTYWKGTSKLPNLKKKIFDFEKENFVVFVVVPKALASFYKPIENNIIYLEELGEQLIVGNKISDGLKFKLLKRVYRKNDDCPGSSDKTEF